MDFSTDGRREAEPPVVAPGAADGRSGRGTSPAKSGTVRHRARRGELRSHSRAMRRGHRSGALLGRSSSAESTSVWYSGAAARDRGRPFALVRSGLAAEGVAIDREGPSGPNRGARGLFVGVASQRRRRISKGATGSWCRRPRPGSPLRDGLWARPVVVWPREPKFQSARARGVFIGVGRVCCGHLRPRSRPSRD